MEIERGGKKRPKGENGKSNFCLTKGRRASTICFYLSQQGIDTGPTHTSSAFLGGTKRALSSGYFTKLILNLGA